MTKNVLMPVIMAGMTQGTLARWTKSEGDAVHRGDVIAEVESDKAVVEIEAECDGVLGRIVVPSGSEQIPVDSVIGVLLEAGETSAAMPLTAFAALPQAVTSSPKAPNGSPVARSTEPGPEASNRNDGGPASGRRFASPLARRLAARSGINLKTIPGSGPHGRIVRLDITRAIETMKITPDARAEAARDGITIPHSTARRVIARRLSEAKRTIPHFYLSADCEIDDLLAVRSEINALEGSAPKVSINDLIIKAAAIALCRVPQANASWTDDAVIQFKDVDISVAVATDNGLITPIIRGADKKSVGAISAEMKSLAERARENRLTPHEFQGGSFSISNLGMFGVRSFSAIINPPQSCILAVGVAEKRPICRGDNIVAATMLTATLSVDHRSVDGAIGARLLQEVKHALEHPFCLLV